MLETLRTILDTLITWLESAPAAIVIAVLIIGPAFAVPISPIWIVVGARFGPWTGMLIGLIGLFGTLSLSHLLARGVLRPLFEKLILRFWPSFPEYRSRRKTALLLLCRCSPIPMAVQNYALALVGVPLGRDLLFSVPIFSLHLLAFIWLGGALTGGGIGPWLAAITLLLLAFGGGQLIRRRIARNADQANQVAAPDQR